VILDGELCEKKGENKNSVAVNKLKTGDNLQINCYCLGRQKIMIFGG